MSRVVVIGSGVAGSSAALAARAQGAEVVMVTGGPGATSLGSGAMDVVPWEEATGAEAVDPYCVELLKSFGCIEKQGALLASATGILRPARAHDAALLDLSKITPGRVLVADLGWDTARAWSAWSAARARGLGFAPLRATITKHTDERAMACSEVASRHDDEGRLAWLASVLKEALSNEGACSAIVLPPWLGTAEARAAQLSSMVGVPCGEAIALAGSPSGRRFESARVRALARAGVEVREGWARKVSASVVDLEEGAPLECDAVVIATGGLIGGGLVYTPAEAILATALPPYPRHVFACAIDAPVTIGAEGSELVVPGSLYGLPPESIAWPFSRDPLIERVGVVHASDGVFVAGDLMADRPRTWLSAMASGVRAGQAAAGPRSS